MYASKSESFPLARGQERGEPRALRVVVAGCGDRLQRTTVRSLRASLYRVFETNLDVGLSLDPADELRGFDLLVVVATTDPDGALAVMEAARREVATLPIVVVAPEAAYLELWPRTAELEVSAFYSLAADLPRFLATVDELLLAP